jgi:hypothetical protein
MTRFRVLDLGPLRSVLPMPLSSSTPPPGEAKSPTEPVPPPSHQHQHDSVEAPQAPTQGQKSGPAGASPSECSGGACHTREPDSGIRSISHPMDDSAAKAGPTPASQTSNVGINPELSDDPTEEEPAVRVDGDTAPTEGTPSARKGRKNRRGGNAPTGNSGESRKGGKKRRGKRADAHKLNME